MRHDVKWPKAQKTMAKDFDVPVLIRYVIDGDYIIVQDFGGVSASYLSLENFKKFRSGKDEASLDVGLKSWCLVMLQYM